MIFLYAFSIFNLFIAGDYFFYISNFLIYILCLFGILSSKRQLELVSLFYIFIIVFMVFIPVNDRFNNNIYWGGSELGMDSFLYVNLIIIFSILAFMIGCILSKRLIFVEYLEKKFQRNYDINIISRIIFLATSSFICYLIYVNNDKDMFAVLFRGYVSDDFQPSVNVKALLLFESYFIRPMPALIMLIYYVNLAGKKILLADKVILFLLFFNTLVFIFPTSVARFLVATVYISILLTFTNVFDRKARMITILIGGIFFVFPLINTFRHFNPNDFTITYNLSFLNEGHFDGYQNFVRLTELNIISYGYQLIGVLLFFFPRSIWADKPIGSGSLLADHAGYWSSNIALPFLGEGYINFWIPGSLVFAFLLGFFLSGLDKSVWSLCRDKRSVLFVVYSIFFGQIFFVLRGDFLSSFAYTVGILCSFLFLLIYFNFLQWVVYRLLSPFLKR